MPKSTFKGHLIWPLDHMLSVVNEIAYYSSYKGTSRMWTVITDLLVKIYRNEQNNSRAAESFYLNMNTDVTKPVVDLDDGGDYD